MLKNYLLIGWRNIIKAVGSSAIHVCGLAAGMAVAILIGVWIHNELNFNKSFANYDRIAQLYHNISFGEDIMAIPDLPAALGEAIRSKYPEVEDVAITSGQGEHILSYQEVKLSEAGLFVEPQFLAMFSITAAQGTASLNDMHSMLISKSLASALFSDNQPIGKVIKVDNRDLLTVVGVFDDFSSNTEFTDVKLLLPLNYYYSINEDHRKQQQSWDAFHFECFVLLNEHTPIEQAESKLKSILYDNTSAEGKALNPVGFLYPMHKWHLYDGIKNGDGTDRNIRFVWMFGTIGVCVLLLACINFMNLSTARSERRSREVGIRKVMGSVRYQLVFQFLSESLLIVLISFLLAVGLAALVLPWFSELAGRKMIFPWYDTAFMLGSLVLILVTGLLAGSYPALYLSSFNAIKVLKGTFKAGRSATIPRKVLVVFQFTTSIVLIVVTVFVFLQLQHAKNRPVGFDREGIVHVAIRTDALANANYNALRHELLATGVVDNMGTSDFPVTGAMSADASLSWEGKDPAQHPLIAMNSCSHDFPKTNGFQFVEGRDFSREFTSDSSAILVNEMTAKLISENGKSVVGKKITFGNDTEREIVGVIKDQVRWTPFMKQSPHLYFVSYKAAGFITVRLNPHVSTHDALKQIEAAIKKFDAGDPFEYEFLDDDYAQQFRHEERIGTLASVFSVLAIFISCIGIFGLATFSVSQRTKEIGIRKVMGASVFNVWGMLSRDFVTIITVAVLLSTPLAYYFTRQWLAQYEYRVEMSWLVFIVTDILVVSITLFTVSHQALAAALTDPVKSLRSE